MTDIVERVKEACRKLKVDERLRDSDLERKTLVSVLPRETGVLVIYLDKVDSDWFGKHFTATTVIDTDELSGRSNAEVLDLVRERVNAAFKMFRQVGLFDLDDGPVLSPASQNKDVTVGLVSVDDAERIINANPSYFPDRPTTAAWDGLPIRPTSPTVLLLL